MAIILAPCTGYGPLDADLLIIHVAEGDGDGLGLASYCCSNPMGYRWHRSIGNTGDAYINLNWTTKGAHVGCLNDRAVGIEHAGFTNKTPWGTRGAQLAASAVQAALFCHAKGKAPNRSFIIGHDEANRSYGGCSTHTDPGSTWPWDDYMALVNAAYEGGEMALLSDDPDYLKGYCNGWDNMVDGSVPAAAYLTRATDQTNDGKRKQSIGKRTAAIDFADLGKATTP